MGKYQVKILVVLNGVHKECTPPQPEYIYYWIYREYGIEYAPNSIQARVRCCPGWVPVQP